MDLRLNNTMRAWQILDLDYFVEEYLKGEKLKSFDERVDILLYNANDLIKSRIYAKAYGKDTDLLSKFADVFMCLIVAIKAGEINLADVVELGLAKYREREWKKKCLSKSSN